MSSIVSFYQGLALAQASTPFHNSIFVKLLTFDHLAHSCIKPLLIICQFHSMSRSFMGCVHRPVNHVCVKSSKDKWLRHDSNFYEKQAKNRIKLSQNKFKIYPSSDLFF